MRKDVHTHSKNNAKTGFGVNLKMDADTYALRRKVIEIIYEAKGYVPTLPRIDVRITDTPTESNHLGIAYLNTRDIYIPKNTLKMPVEAIREVVLHEIVHAVTGFIHDDNCPLMSPTLSKNLLSKELAYESFVKYFK